MIGLGGSVERWAVDLTWPFCLSEGNRFICTAICPFSKFAIAVPMRNKEVNMVAKVIVELIILKCSLCFLVLTHQGPENFQVALSMD